MLALVLALWKISLLCPCRLNSLPSYLPYGCVDQLLLETPSESSYSSTTLTCLPHSWLPHFFTSVRYAMCKRHSVERIYACNGGISPAKVDGSSSRARSALSFISFNQEPHLASFWGVIADNAHTFPSTLVKSSSCLITTACPLLRSTIFSVRFVLTCNTRSTSSLVTAGFPWGRLVSLAYDIIHRMVWSSSRLCHFHLRPSPLRNHVVSKFRCQSKLTHPDENFTSFFYFTYYRSKSGHI